MPIPLFFTDADEATFQQQILRPLYHSNIMVASEPCANRQPRRILQDSWLIVLTCMRLDGREASVKVNSRTCNLTDHLCGIAPAEANMRLRVIRWQVQGKEKDQGSNRGACNHQYRLAHYRAKKLQPELSCPWLM